MKRWTLALSALLTTALSASSCAATHRGPARPSPDEDALARVVGAWDTSEGQASWAVQDGHVTGHYNQDGGRVFLDLDGHVARGYWVENESNERCETERDGSYHWGRMALTFDESFSSFTGWWSYCDATENHNAWTGKKVRGP